MYLAFEHLLDVFLKPFYGDVLLVCVDCEGWQSTSEVRTSEIGISILDTRHLRGMPINSWKDHLHSCHFRTSELEGIKPNRFGCSKYCPDRFHFGRSQDIRINDRATLLDFFFRVPNQQDAVQWITREVRQLVAGPPASTPRALDPITREVRQLVGESVQGTIPHLPASR